MLDAAIAQIQEPYRKKLLVTVDGAGSTHALVDHITALNNDPAHPDREVYYAVGFDLDERGHRAIGRVPEQVWEPALDAEGEPRDGAGVAELTGLYRTGPAGDHLAGWPTDMRVIARREKPHPGAQLPCSSSTRAGASGSPPSASRPGRSSSSRPATGFRPASRPVSDAGRTPGCVGCHRNRSRSTRRGVPRSQSPATCWPGWPCSAWTASWPEPNQKRSATGCYTPPAGSSTASAAAGYVSPKPAPEPKPLVRLQLGEPLPAPGATVYDIYGINSAVVGQQASAIRSVKIVKSEPLRELLQVYAPEFYQEFTEATMNRREELEQLVATVTAMTGRQEAVTYLDRLEAGVKEMDQARERLRIFIVKEFHLQR